MRTRQELERIRTETKREVAVVKEAGGNVAFIFGYLKDVKALESQEDQASVAMAGKTFRRRPVQISAVAAMKDMATLACNGHAFDLEHSDRLSKAARAACVSASGHFTKDSLASLPEPGPEATARRQKAAADWDRLVGTDLDSLATLSCSGMNSGRRRRCPNWRSARGSDRSSSSLPSASQPIIFGRVADMNSATIALEIGEPDIDRCSFEACLRSFI
ncbi:hypothetical protein RFM99_20380 [Mesorhizobium sp. VK4C]|uniref:hypothetical protein n=1 Tax=Mesorhizobium captivum TaxID=3072319 RepID=UPI002A24B85F|nr:hypothetical protein [Mesorhizobium sp. VK4C]MDX8500762.1 hypothetical protein [Mesorhizobium sp. VK4C]